MQIKRLLPTIMALLVIVVLAGCTSSFIVQVSAIADPKISTTGTRYILLNGNTEGQEGDLFFREFSAYFIPILTKKGYQRVESREDADVEIFFRYAISDGRTGINTFARPIYETVGGNTINITRTRTDGSGATTTTRSTVHVPLQTFYAGTVIENRSYTLYTSSAALEAYKIKPAGKILWKTLMNTTSETNDLRTTIPIMAAAAAPYIAGNSGTAKKIRLKRDDPRINTIRKNAGQ
ncbi:MAG: hypothetical protein L3J98_16620 [Gammaproteobacteria bacterium]|nr:hypothetical protein [Gammaproteobacteria bacterium]MCF6261757.1 hypothetical protein [Gammaproteobacteria bacterium]